MYSLFFAHAGEHHETAAEAAQHANGLSVSTPLLFWSALIIIPLILVLGLQAFKTRLSTKLLAVSTFLIIFSVVSYQNPGAYSVIALALGFGMVLLLSIASLTAPKE